jgi:aspartyl-tRNA(Asn)/glutamyl-tRNA(Gln) amidotransferase subunit C
MKLNKKEIQHIAELSRLELNKDEEKLFASQISSILDYMKILDDVDVSGVSPTAFVGGLKNVWRSDVAVSWPQDEIDLALSSAELENGLVKVKRVL